MSKENTRARKLELIFGQHAKTDVFYVTSNDRAFFQKADANRYAKTLEDKTVEEVRREDVIKPTAKAKPKEAKADAPTASDPESREALATLHKELFGKAPAKTTKLETIKARVEAEQAKRDAETEKSGGDPKDDGGGKEE